MIKEKILLVANEKMPAIIPSMFKGLILQNIDTMITDNGEAIVVELGEKLSHMAITSIDISKMVEDNKKLATTQMLSSIGGFGAKS